MKGTRTIWWTMPFIITIAVAGCKKDNEDNAQALIEKHGLVGTFTAQITPAFMGTSPMTSGEHTVYFEDLGNGKIRMHYEKFQADPMPFEMTVDITMDVKAGSNNTVIVEGKNGTFRAEPPNGEEIDPDDLPDGIQLPEGSEGGLSSNQASVSGTFAQIEKDGQTAWRYDLNVIPGVPLPIEILIYTKGKL